MLSQGWIRSGDQSLAMVLRWPDKRDCNLGAVLISGFSQSMCDTDYFMSRLARRLVSEGIYVLQVDPRGHGDSPGNLEDVTLDMLRADIRSAFTYAAEQWNTRRDTHRVSRLMGVGRGLTATLMAEVSLDLELDGIVGIYPYCLDPAAVKDLSQKIRPGIIDTADILTGKDFSYFTDFDHDWMAFFDALGSGFLYNLIGQKVSTGILQELINYHPALMLTSQPETKLWLMPAHEVPEGYCSFIPEETHPYLSLQEYRENPFPSDTWWYHHVIERVCGWMIEKRGEKGANSGSSWC